MSAQIDKDISEVEQRIARRRMSVELTARAAWKRTVSRVLSPVGMLGAAAVGFVTVARFLRPRPKIVERRSGGRGAAKAGKWAGILSLVTSAGIALVKAQYGGPVQIAQKVIGQVNAYKAKKNRERHSAAVAR